MASSVILLHNLSSLSPHPPKCYKNQSLSHSQFLSSKSLLSLSKQNLMPSNLHLNKLKTQKSRSTPVVFALQSNFFKAIQTVWKIGRDGIEAGTNLVPDSVPRPAARISVTVLALSVSLFVLKSLLSTAFFVVATMGLVYFIFIALNKDEGPRGGGGSTTSTPSTEDTLEEARKIMEKYK
ncbi:hypothetical protein CFOL_v3_14162 [Cephalotus follicularis]|uniref:Transmembrane protein n=1 Tax=Cephalotus follicularis TaxID=3775 RepID=A0A1Q3BRY8_CEPFO|nr:hypothetical protein CFOL_v3_14162 [Cephalotus follicularis]